MIRNVKLLSDCEFVLVSRIGHSVESALEQQGIVAYVIPDIIENAVIKLISYVKISKMINDIAR